MEIWTVVDQRCHCRCPRGGRKGPWHLIGRRWLVLGGGSGLVGESEFLPGVVSVRIPRWLHVFFWSAGTSLELALQGGQQGVRGGVEHPLEGADRRLGGWRYFACFS